MKGHSLPVSEVYKYNFVNVRYGNGMEEGGRAGELFCESVCHTRGGESGARGLGQNQKLEAS